MVCVACLLPLFLIPVVNALPYLFDLILALWLARLLGDLFGKDAEAVELRVDSKFALALAKNPVFHERSKHIIVKYHFIRGCLEEGSVRANYINTKDQLADLLTKSLGRIKFQELCSRIRMVQLLLKTRKT